MKLKDILYSLIYLLLHVYYNSNVLIKGVFNTCFLVISSMIICISKDVRY